VIAVLGVALLLVSLLAWVVGLHFKALRYFDRPALARTPLFDPIITSLRWLSLAGGLTLLWRASPPAAGVAAAVLLLGWGYRRSIRSVPFRRRLLRREFAAARRLEPELPEREILFRLVMERHPRWGEELIEQMINDYPTVDQLARMLAKMERGFRGFR